MTEKAVAGLLAIAILALSLSFYYSPPGTTTSCLSPKAISDLKLEVQKLEATLKQCQQPAEDSSNQSEAGILHKLRQGLESCQSKVKQYRDSIKELAGQKPDCLYSECMKFVKECKGNLKRLLSGASDVL